MLMARLGVWKRQDKDDFKVFLLSNQKNRIVIYWNEEGYIKRTCLKRKVYFGFRHVKFEMPGKHWRADDLAAYLIRRKVWVKGIKSVSLQMLFEDEHSWKREQVQGLSPVAHQYLVVMMEMRKNRQRKPWQSNWWSERWTKSVVS